MDRTRSGIAAVAEDLLRMLAAAINATRLYPAASPLRTDAIARFTGFARQATAAHGPMQYRVDRGRFILSETSIGEGLPQIAALAEALHALQVGQLIIAPGLSEPEAASFLDVIGTDAHVIRGSGGFRSALLAAGVANIAVVEVSLRTSTEEGLLGLDLTTATPEDIAREFQGAVVAWTEGENAPDLIQEAVDRLEPAARDLAMKRCAEALLLLDEATRMQMLSSAVPSEVPQSGMDGLLNVVAHMPPAALARLLKLTAESQGNRPDSLIGAIEFPPELAAELAALLRPSPQTEAERGVPPEADVIGIVREVAESDEEDLRRIGSMVTSVTARSAAARGLATTVQIATDRPTEDAVHAITDAIKPAAKEGTLDELAAAAVLLEKLDDNPALSSVVQSARSALHDPALLERCVKRLSEDPTSESAKRLVHCGGNAGADALVSAYLDASPSERTRLVPVAAEMIEIVAPVAGRVLRAGDAASAEAVLGLLGAIGSRRLAATIVSGLEHLDSRVREAAVIALASSPGQEGTQLLIKTLGHWDPETRRIAAREIGRTGNQDAVPALLKVVADVSLFERNYELKKEVLKSLESLRSPQAVPVLKRIARRGPAIGKKNRELRYLAQRVLESLE
ncbi:MAG: HEAT repeat domain-containing protein [Actinobacteria bacterium]|nr:HEAT repeat domain-containing protein [Actinomycetota bacterium]